MQTLKEYFFLYKQFLTIQNCDISRMTPSKVPNMYCLLFMSYLLIDVPNRRKEIYLIQVTRQN